MSVNKYQPHVFVLCEDDANRQIANGFLLDPSLNGRNIQILEPAGGWRHVLDDFTNTHVDTMSKYPHRYMILVIDFDGVENRLQKVREIIPQDLVDRVFVLGALIEPEGLRTANLGTWENIGQNLARDCRENTTITWSHKLLMHNADELKRIIPILKPILFT